MHSWRIPLLLLTDLVLAGCATYSSLPLPQHAKLAASTRALTAPVTAFETPGVRAARVDLRRPLDATAVATLAVLNDPMLSAMRTEAGVAAAQSYAAGLLPWPQITLGAGRPDPAGTGLSNPWSLSLEQNVAALLQHGAIKHAAQASQARVQLDVIWDEWQVAQQARFVYADIEADVAERAALQPLVALYAVHLKAAQAGVAQGRVPQSAALEAKATYASFVTQLNALQLRHDKDMAVLRGLLGLAPQAPLKLALDDHPSLMDTKNLREALAALPHRRPDLMALAAAYKNADERLRQAVAAQFPLIGVSIHRERDTEGVISNGLSLTLNLPFLNGARGEVAVARATRQTLHATYQARLDEAVTETTALSEEAASLQRQIVRLRQTLGQLPPAPKTTLGNVTFNILAAYLTQRNQIAAQIARLHCDLDQATIALDTLVGMPLDNTRSHPAHSL
ncbi:MAG: TolC family protein [Gammaproteobacteria bacterium]|nr:TolC family protein [Gammaproteobacteria bacterium]